jgi:thiol-disulfide isomerase/thioredoxin
LGHWCAPCRAEIPVILKLERDWAAKGLVVVRITDERAEDVTAFQRDAHQKFRSFVDGASVLRQYQINARPVTITIDRTGRITSYDEALLTETELVERLKKTGPGVEDLRMNADLERLNQIWLRAWFEKDVALVEKLMADEYVYIAPNGQVLDRQAVLKIIQSPSYHLDNGTRTELIIKPVAEDVAVVVHRWQGEGRFEGKSFRDDHRCSMLCVRRGSEWRVMLEQCSPNNR